MKTLIAGLILSLSGFVVTSFVATDAMASQRCGPSFQVSRSAGSKAEANAKRHAQRKAWRAARKRCGAGRVAVRVTGAWDTQCSRRGKLMRCTSVSSFRCCKGKGLARTKRRRMSRKRRVARKRRTVRKKRLARRTRRTRRTRRVSRISRAGMCVGKHKVQGTGQSKRKVGAQREARNKVYQNAKAQCGGKHVRYVSSWKYNCQKSGGSYDCTASNVVRCCRSKGKTRISRRKRRRAPRRKAN